MDPTVGEKIVTVAQVVAIKNVQCKSSTGYKNRPLCTSVVRLLSCTVVSRTFALSKTIDLHLDQTTLGDKHSVRQKNVFMHK